jgi:hypothetical protein
MANGGTDWGALITAIGGSTMGVISVLTNRPILAPQPTSILDAAVGTDLRTQQQNTGLLVLVVVGVGLFLLARK